MNNTEKTIRIKQAINETYNLLGKTVTRYDQSIEYLKMEIKDNKKFGNNINANKSAVEHANKYKVRVSELKRHITKLENMIKDIK